MAKQLKEAEILEAYRTASGKNVTEFAHWLEMSRTAYYNILNGAQMKTEDLQWSAVTYVGTEFGNLAVDLLNARGAVVPCVCLEMVGDNGQCPKHKTAFVVGVAA